MAQLKARYRAHTVTGDVVSENTRLQPLVELYERSKDIAYITAPRGQVVHGEKNNDKEHSTMATNTGVKKTAPAKKAAATPIAKKKAAASASKEKGGCSKARLDGWVEQIGWEAVNGERDGDTFSVELFDGSTSKGTFEGATARLAYAAALAEVKPLVQAEKSGLRAAKAQAEADERAEAQAKKATAKK